MNKLTTEDTENTEMENDLQCELAAWEPLREAESKLAEARREVAEAREELATLKKSILKPPGIKIPHRWMTSWINCGAREETK